jgi:hypothetical protein
VDVSIITVSFNRAATIEDTIRSVSSQTHRAIEHIIVGRRWRDGCHDANRVAPSGPAGARGFRVGADELHSTDDGIEEILEFLQIDHVRKATGQKHDKIPGRLGTASISGP